LINENQKSKILLEALLNEESIVPNIDGVRSAIEQDRRWVNVNAWIAVDS